MKEILPSASVPAGNAGFLPPYILDEDALNWVEKPSPRRRSRHAGFERFGEIGAQAAAVR